MIFLRNLVKVSSLDIELQVRALLERTIAVRQGQSILKSKTFYVNIDVRDGSEFELYPLFALEVVYKKTRIPFLVF